jgi:hypothetical protein
MTLINQINYDYQIVNQSRALYVNRQQSVIILNFKR